MDTLGSSIDNVLAALTEVRRVGEKWRARCPAHDDREPSLSIHTGDEGRVLLYGHAGFIFEQVVAHSYSISELERLLFQKKGTQ